MGCGSSVQNDVQEEESTTNSKETTSKKEPAPAETNETPGSAPKKEKDELEDSNYSENAPLVRRETLPASTTELPISWSKKNNERKDRSVVKLLLENDEGKSPSMEELKIQRKATYQRVRSFASAGSETDCTTDSGFDTRQYQFLERATCFFASEEYFSITVFPTDLSTPTNPSLNHSHSTQESTQQKTPANLQQPSPLQEEDEDAFMVTKVIDFSRMPALKKLLDEYPNIIERVINSHNMLLNCPHFHIVRTLFTRKDAINPLKFYINTEFVGKTIVADIPREDVLDFLSQILCDVAGALRYLHSHEMSHRMLNCQSIVAVGWEAFCVINTGYEKLMKYLSPEELINIIPIEMRCPSLFPPEIFFSDSPESVHAEKCDIWALGILAFRLAYGISPFEVEDETVFFQQIMQDEVPLSNFPEPTTMFGLNSFISACLDKDPQNRPTIFQLMQKHSFLKQPSLATSMRSSFAVNSHNPEEKSEVTPQSTKSLSLSPGNPQILLPAFRHCSFAKTNSPPEYAIPEISVLDHTIFCAKCGTACRFTMWQCQMSECEGFTVCAECFENGVEHHHPLEQHVLEEFGSVSITLEKSTLETPELVASHRVSRDDESVFSSSGIDHTRNRADSSPQTLNSGYPSSKILANDSTTSAHSSNEKTSPLQNPMRRRSSTLCIPAKQLDSHELLVFGMTGALPQTSRKLSLMRAGKTQAHRPLQAQESGEFAPKTPVKKLIPSCSDVMAQETPEQIIQEVITSKSTDMQLHSLQLTELPMQLFKPIPIDAITSLDISHNKLTYIPHEISYLTGITKLNLGENELTELPEALGDLPDLTILDVNNNKLKDLPQSLMFCDKLDTIAMDYNCCQDFPGVLYDLPCVTVLYLAANYDLREWPSIEFLKKLGQIRLGLDNEPNLYEKWEAMQPSLPHVEIMWNKIYPDRIIPNLYCGSLRSAQTDHVYHGLNIKYLLTVGRGLEPSYPADVTHKVIIVDDIEGANIDHAFEQCSEFTEMAQKNNAGCLVHCFAGMSRSATAVIAFLMMQKGMRLDEAYNTTRKARPAIYPNKGFFDQLLGLDVKLFPGQRALDMESMERHKVPL